MAQLPLPVLASEFAAALVFGLVLDGVKIPVFARLMRLAGRFSRRIHGYAKANGIPVAHCPAGERKHELAEEYLAKTNITQGLFLILVGRAQAPVWDVSVNHHIEPKKPMPHESGGQTHLPELR